MKKFFSSLNTQPNHPPDSYRDFHSSIGIMLCLFIFIFSSCTKNIEVKVPDYKQRLVVEGAVEPGIFPRVYLTWTAPYFGNQNYSNFQQYLVTGAFVTVTDGLTTDTLKEVFPGQGFFYQGTHMTGVVGRTYDLTIKINGNTYTSSSTINPPIALDSIYFKGEDNDTLGFLWAHFKEPPGHNNQYRWYAKRIGKDQDYLAPFYSAFDDKFIDGKDFDFAFDRGMVANSTAYDDQVGVAERGLFKEGDSVVVKFCTIGEKEFRYLRSYYLNGVSNGNPFAAPSNLESNISGDAIGLWCAYGPYYVGRRLKKF